MKKLQKLKLNKLSVEALENREMNQLAGGCSIVCGCSCCYSQSGGYSDATNRVANSAKSILGNNCDHTDCSSVGITHEYEFCADVTCDSPNRDYWRV